ncbi:hypothetical protein BX070DRAFT_230450 [Coemansia spiralis]|nr:hypothetical protein BX070DRAFT_230450 [Coemansia spiralis]
MNNTNDSTSGANEAKLPSKEQKGSIGKTESVFFDELVSQSTDGSSAGASQVNTSHPAIFRKGTLIEIPEVTPQTAQRRRSHHSQIAALKPRLVAICIKEDAHCERIIDWALQKELVPGRDSVVLIHVRLAANSIVGDLVSTNSAKEDAERIRSHELLRKRAALIKQDGFYIKGVSIRGVDVRGELVRKLFELKCDIVIIGCRSSKSLRERFTGHKADYLAANSPCPVLIIRDDVSVNRNQEELV